MLIRSLLKDHGVELKAMSFGLTDAKKPYIVCRKLIDRGYIDADATSQQTASSGLSEPIGYNITHDNGVVAMAYSIGSELFPDPPAYRIGIDIMLLQLPKRTPYDDFVETVSDQVSAWLS